MQIYGDSTQAFLLAVVVPHTGLLDLDDAELRRQLRDALNDTAAQAGLQPYEIPRDFIVERNPFTEANTLLTVSGKSARPELIAHYRPALDELYAKISAMLTDDLYELRAGSADRSVLDTVKLAIQATLGVPSGELEARTQFIDIGGDSLSALSLSTLLEDVFQTDVPVSVLIDPTTDLGYLSESIATSLQGRTHTANVSAVHGSLTEVRADELTLDKFIDADILARAPQLKPPTGEIRTVLLTGVTGFLGRFQCLDWMQQLAESGGKVICIARGNSNTEAAQRLWSVFNTDDELAHLFTELAADQLEVLAGDLSSVRLGLSESDWQRLSDEVDLISHTGALVNHMLPYRQLFGPNVRGTAEVLRLAMTSRLKQVSYVSTLAAAAAASGPLVDEDSDIRTASATHRIDDSAYANGYSISKWAGEVLCREAHDLCDLPVAVFRCNMILAHSRYAGQLNAPDVFSRLLISLLITGIAPQSFYHGGAAGAHYDGLPVDFIASATTRIGVDQSTGYGTYNIVNPHDDGISLDTFVAWIEDAGQPLTRVADFDDWRQRFATALRALPEQTRQHTLINLLDVVGSQGMPSAGSPFSSQRFQTAVGTNSKIAGGAIPHLSKDLIVKYVNDLHELGYEGTLR